MEVANPEMFAVESEKQSDGEQSEHQQFLSILHKNTTHVFKWKSLTLFHPRLCAKKVKVNH